MRRLTIQLNILSFFTILLATMAIVYFILLFIFQDEFQATLPLFLILFVLLLMLLGTSTHYILISFTFLLPFSATGFLPPVFREILNILLIFMIISYIFINRIEGIKLTSGSFNFLNTPLKLLFISIVISTIYAVSKGFYNKEMIKGLIWFLEFSIIILIFPVFIDNSNKIKKIVDFLVVGFLIAGMPFLFMIIKYFGKTVISVAGRVLNLNAVAMLLTPISLLCVGLLVEEKNNIRRVFLILTLVVLFLNLLITRSRGAWFGFIVGFVYIVIASKSYKWLIYMTILVVVVLLFQNFQFIFFGRIKQTSFVDPALLSRFYIWTTAVSIIKNNFLTGIGIHNFLNIKYIYGFPKWLDPAKAFFTHNLYLEFLVDVGVMGFIAFIMLFVTTLKRMNILSKKERNLRSIAFGINGALIAYLAHGLFDYCFWFSPTLILLAIFFSLAVAIEKNQENFIMS